MTLNCILSSLVSCLFVVEDFSFKVFKVKRVICSYDRIKKSANLTNSDLAVFLARLQLILNIDILKFRICIFTTRHTLLPMYVK